MTTSLQVNQPWEIAPAGGLEQKNHLWVNPEVKFDASQIGYVNQFGHIYCGPTYNIQTRKVEHLYLADMLKDARWKEGLDALTDMNIKKARMRDDIAGLNGEFGKHHPIIFRMPHDSLIETDATPDQAEYPWRYHSETCKNFFRNKDALEIGDDVLHIYNDLRGHPFSGEARNMITGEKVRIADRDERLAIPLVYSSGVQLS